MPCGSRKRIYAPDSGHVVSNAVRERHQRLHVARRRTSAQLIVIHGGLDWDHWRSTLILSSLILVAVAALSGSQILL